MRRIHFPSGLGILLAAAGLAASACSPVSPAAGAEAPPQTPADSFAPITALPELTTSSAAPPPTIVPIVGVATGDPRGRLVVNGTGDVNLDPGFVRSFRSEGYEYAWSGLDDIFLQDDLTVVNLECSASLEGTPWDKPFVFRCDPAALPSMASAGIEIANLANNHSIDYGFAAMLDSRQNLLSNGITPVGAGANAAEAYSPAVFEIDGWTVAVLGGGGVSPETGSWVAREDRPGMTNGDSIPDMVAAIEAADEVADLVFVTIHWGEQGATTPHPADIRRAEAYIDAGADAIFGHHSHRLNPLGWYRGRPIAWSLGNFVWQAFPQAARRTAIAQVVVEPDGRIGACLIPAYIERTGHPVLEAPYEAPCAPDGPR